MVKGFSEGAPIRRCATPSEDLESLSDAIEEARSAFLHAISPEAKLVWKEQILGLLFNDKGTFAPAMRELCDWRRAEAQSRSPAASAERWPASAKAAGADPDQNAFPCVPSPAETDDEAKASMDEIAALRHDLDRYMAIAQEMTDEVERLRSQSQSGLGHETTCYIERSEVREILLNEGDIPAETTSYVLHKIDQLPISTSADFRSQSEIAGFTIDALRKQAFTLNPSDQYRLAAFIAENIRHEVVSIVDLEKLGFYSRPTNSDDLAHLIFERISDSSTADYHNIPETGLRNLAIMAAGAAMNYFAQRRSQPETEGER